MCQQFKPGDAVTWGVYGKAMRGTIVQTRGDGVAIIRRHDTWNRTWAHCESLTLAGESAA